MKTYFKMSQNELFITGIAIDTYKQYFLIIESKNSNSRNTQILRDLNGLKTKVNYYLYEISNYTLSLSYYEMSLLYKSLFQYSYIVNGILQEETKDLYERVNDICLKMLLYTKVDFYLKDGEQIGKIKGD